MESQTTADRFTMNYDGVNYMTNNQLNADVTMAMDLDKILFTFKDNKVASMTSLPALRAPLAMPNDTISTST